MYAKVFEHYAKRALYGQQARGLISQAIADLPSLSLATLETLLTFARSFRILCYWQAEPKICSKNCRLQARPGSQLNQP
jgi:hypothetical protein